MRERGKGAKEARKGRGDGGWTKQSVALVVVGLWEDHLKARGIYGVFGVGGWNGAAHSSVWRSVGRCSGKGVCWVFLSVRSRVFCVTVRVCCLA